MNLGPTVASHTMDRRLLTHRRTASDVVTYSHRRTFSDEHNRITVSDEEEEGIEGASPLPELCGQLSKWTNYIHGWQNRYFVLKNGTLSYYKSMNETTSDCRGAVSIYKATVKGHDFDECRFEVSMNDSFWYLRAETSEEKQKWLEALEAHKADSGFGSQSSLRRHESSLSIASNTLSTTSTNSKSIRGIREKLSELETFRDIVCRQIDTLQGYFDNCADTANTGAIIDEKQDLHEAGTILDDGEGGQCSQLLSREVIQQHAHHSVDFRGEAITFKATTAGILATLSHCMEVLAQREEAWRRKCEREMEKRRRAEEMLKEASKEADTRRRVVLVGGPDYEEGPHSAIGEEEFFDAVETGLDKIEEHEEWMKERLMKARQRSESTPSTPLIQHRLWPEIKQVSEEQLRYALLGVEEGVWTLFAQEGEMRMYKREEEVDGMVCDPLKAVHTIRGVTAHEITHYFFHPDYRMDWEFTVDNMTVLERVSEDCIVFHQIHKRVWPATQRDSLYWSHIRQVHPPPDEGLHDSWIVCNQSTEHPEAPTSGKWLRVNLTVCMVAQTQIVPPPPEGELITRDNLQCKIIYCSVVNPGGWAPASVLRAVYKREYPRFLKRFTQYVIDQCQDKPILF